MSRELEQIVESFGDVVDEYERGRPGYASEAIDLIVEEFSIGPHSRLLDIGAGTGKLTKQLLDTGAKVVALEPVDAMRKRLAANVGNADVVGGKAESIPIPTDSVDLIACGQSFHWFRTEEALREFHRVLNRGGGLALVWNTRDDSVSWVKWVSEVIDRYEPRSRELDASGTWQLVFDQLDLFLPLRREEFRYLQPMDEETLVAAVKSRSYIASLENSVREEVIHQVREIVRSHPDLVGRERFEFPYITDVHLSRAAY